MRACIFLVTYSPRLVSRLASRRRARTSEPIALGVDDRSRSRPLAKRGVRDRWRTRHRRRRRRRASRDARAQ